MIAVTAYMTAREGREAEFERTFLQMVDTVRANEPGCRLYLDVDDAKLGSPAVCFDGCPENGRLIDAGVMAA